MMPYSLAWPDVHIKRSSPMPNGPYKTSIGTQPLKRWIRNGLLRSTMTNPMRKFVTIDDSKYPIVITRYQKFDPTPEEFRQMQLDLEVYSASHSDFVMIIDLTDLSFLPAEMRISQAKWSKQMDPLFVKQRMKAVFCTPSSIGQIMLKGVFLLAKPGVPYAVVGSINEGVSWAQKQLNGTKPGNTVYS